MEYVGKGKTALMLCNRSHGIEIRNLDADPIEGRSVIKNTPIYFSSYCTRTSSSLLIIRPCACTRHYLTRKSERKKSVITANSVETGCNETDSEMDYCEADNCASAPTNTQCSSRLLHTVRIVLFISAAVPCTSFVSLISNGPTCKACFNAKAQTIQSQASTASRGPLA